MHLIGYWIESLLDNKHVAPQELVADVPAQAREAVARYLDSGNVFQTYRGVSWCRFGCRHQPMGSRELSDGQWVWPEGLSHYVRDHNVSLPEKFIAHVLDSGGITSTHVPDETPSEQLWLEWCRANASRHFQVELESALDTAHARARQLREEGWKLKESTVGTSDTQCVHKNCANLALQGVAICAEHASALDGFDPGEMAYYEGLWKVLKV